MALTQEQTTTVQTFVAAIVETVGECGEHGAPEGILYAVLMGYGCSLELFRAMVDPMVRQGVLRRTGHVLYLGESCPRIPSAGGDPN